MHRAHRGHGLGRAGLLVGLSALVMACAGGRSLDRATVSGPVATTAPVPTASGPAGRPTDVAPSGAVPAGSPGVGDGTAGSTLSTREASQLLDQVDGILRQLDGELAADADAAINQGE